MEGNVMNTSNGDGAAENKRLRETIAHLEGQLQANQKTIAKLSEERDQYLRTILDWHSARYTEEQLRQWATEVVDEKPQTIYEVFEELGISRPECS
jgi:hypothetical protein